MNTDIHSGNILFIDFETSDLIARPHTVPLEVAAIATDQDLRILGEFGPFAIASSELSLRQMPTYVRNMHQSTGLLQRVQSAGVPLGKVDQFLAQFIDTYFHAKGSLDEIGKKYRGAVIAGNSVKFDYDVIERFMPATLTRIDYRVIDVTSVAELTRRWHPEAWESLPAKKSDHTAMTDIRSCLDELKHFKRTWGFSSTQESAH